VSRPLESALGGAAAVLAVAVTRMQDALPALGRVVADVEQDWLDAQGRAWVARAERVRRTLDRELGAALATGRLAASAVERLIADPAGGESRGPTRRRDPGTGPRLGSTDAQRTDGEQGMRIAQLTDP